jgi:tRNA pseudouridine synthase 9
MSTTTLDQLPPIEASDSPSPPPPRTSPAQNKQQRPRAPKKSRTQNVSKFVNLPPSPLYYFEDGLRKVHPYDYTYNTFCKERWRGKTLLEIFSAEFRDRPLEYYVRLLLHTSFPAVLTIRR